MVINSRTLEADDKKKRVTFAGDVEAKRDDFTVFCQNLVVLYVKSDEQKGAEGVSARIDKIVCHGRRQNRSCRGGCGDWGKGRLLSTG